MVTPLGLEKYVNFTAKLDWLPPPHPLKGNPVSFIESLPGLSIVMVVWLSLVVTSVIRMLVWETCCEDKVESCHWRKDWWRRGCRCITLHCITWHYITLHYIALYCIVLHCIALSCIALHCPEVSLLWDVWKLLNRLRFVLYCIAFFCIVLHCIALSCIELHCIALS